MRRIEAEWIGDRLNELPVETLSPILEVGSSSLHFRTVEKPHIEELVHAPQRARGVRILTADIRNEDGVDIAGDVFEPDVQEQLRAVGARTLLLCNLLEHLKSPKNFASTCQSLVPAGSLIFVTVPNDYPYHLDPIDTMFRPDVAAIQALFPGSELVTGEILVDGNRWNDLRAKNKSFPRTLLAIGGDFARMLTLRGGLQRARSRFSSLGFLFRNYKIAVAILRTP